MKTKTILTVSVVAAFAAGFLVGDFHATSSWIRWNNDKVRSSYAAHVFTYSLALTKLRGGQEKEGVEILDDALEVSLFALDNDYTLLAREHDRATLEAIRLARDYRTKYPWDNTNVLIQARVSQVLALEQ